MDLNAYETFKFERRGNILTAIINRPDHMNAVNAQMHTEMASVFYDLQKDPDSDVIVLTGEGRAFCAGGDTAWFQKMIDDPLTVLQSLKKTASMVAPAPMGGPDAGMSDPKAASSRENMRESDRVFLEKLGF